LAQKMPKECHSINQLIIVHLPFPPSDGTVCFNATLFAVSLQLFHCHYLIELFS
jgi:hypothetical protein